MDSMRGTQEKKIPLHGLRMQIQMENIFSLLLMKDQLRLILKKIDSYYYNGKLGTSVITRHSTYTYMISTFFYNPILVKVDSIIDPILSQNNKTFILGINSDLDNEITVKYNTSTGSYMKSTQAEFWTD